MEAKKKQSTRTWLPKTETFWAGLSRLSNTTTTTKTTTFTTSRNYEFGTLRETRTSKGKQIEALLLQTILSLSVVYFALCMQGINLEACIFKSCSSFIYSTDNLVLDLKNKKITTTASGHDFVGVAT